MWPFKNKELSNVINKTKTFKLNGVVFKIKNIDVLNYLDGSQTLIKVFENYQPKQGNENTEIIQANLNKIKAHYKDVFLASVVIPKMVRKEDEPGFFIEDIFKDWDLCQNLYNEIIKLSYGKKKMKL